jgi:hypothetical protein
VQPAMRITKFLRQAAYVVQIKLLLGSQLMTELQQPGDGSFVSYRHGSGGLGDHEIQRARDVALHFLAMDHRVQHAVLEKEFAALEAFR